MKPICWSTPPILFDLAIENDFRGVQIESAEAAEDLIAEAQAELDSFIAEGDTESAEQICSDWFGLEPDFLIELF